MSLHLAPLCRKFILPVCVLSWSVPVFAGMKSASAEQLIEGRDPSVDAAEVVALVTATEKKEAGEPLATTSSVAPPPPVPLIEKAVSAASSEASKAIPSGFDPQLAVRMNVSARESEEYNSAGPPEGSADCVSDECIDQYLWSIYLRAPKEGPVKVQEQTKVVVKERGRPVTVVRTFTKVSDEDFSWKDPRAAEKAGMQLMDYVIGGVDREFKQKLFHMLRAAEAAGFSLGITSAFRDDYRQSIASGFKAASNRSYHGGSLRGGYGHGLAADLVSVAGTTRSQRLTSSRLLWDWIDANGRKFGIGRPYRDKDPPHAAPVNGKEYADHHPYSKNLIASSASKLDYKLAARDTRRSQ